LPQLPRAIFRLPPPHPQTPRWTGGGGVGGVSAAFPRRASAGFSEGVSTCYATTLVLVCRRRREHDINGFTAVTQACCEEAAWCAVLLREVGWQGRLEGPAGWTVSVSLAKSRAENDLRCLRYPARIHAASGANTSRTRAGAAATKENRQATCWVGRRQRGEARGTGNKQRAEKAAGKPLGPTLAILTRTARVGMRMMSGQTKQRGAGESSRTRIAAAVGGGKKKRADRRSRKVGA